MPDIALRQSHPANDRAKSMLLASVGVKVVLEPPRRRFGRGWALSRGRLSLTKKPPKTLAQRPPGQNSTQIRMKACGQAMVHFQPAGDRSFASAPLTVAPNARSCATCANLASWIFFTVDVADCCRSLQRLPPRVLEAERRFPLSLAHLVGE